MVHPGHRVSHMMPHPPPCIWVCFHDQSLQPLYSPTITIITSFITNKSSNVIIHSRAYLPRHARPTCGPLAQRLSSSASSTCTSMASPLAIAASNGGIWSINNPGIHGAACLRVWGGGWQPCHTRIMQAPAGHPSPSESDCGSSYASPLAPSMIASQS